MTKTKSKSRSGTKTPSGAGRPRRPAHSLVRWTTIAGLFAVLAVAIYAGLAEQSAQPSRAPLPAVEVAVYGYEVVRAYPHDPEAFTQGLIYRDGHLYEGTGLNGRSTLREVNLETGEVVSQVRLGNQYFGEGITDWGSRILQLTWQSQLGFVYDRSTLEVIRTFDYQGEGWGLTHDTSTLIMSDGTPNLRFFAPDTFEEIGTLEVRDGVTPVSNLNELEYVRGEIYANVWQTDRVAIVSPVTGRVTGWIDLDGLLSASEQTGPGAVLNGIAYDAVQDRLFVTGKLWPKLFEIELVRR